MSVLEHKIDFAVLVTAANANPNGDPLNGNRPRENYDSCGEISDVCIKRKIRNRLQDMGENVYVQSKDHARTDDFTNLSDRATKNEHLSQLVKGKDTDQDAFAKAACEERSMCAALDRFLQSKAVSLLACVDRFRFTRQSAFPR